MKADGKFCIALVSAPSLIVARKLARVALNDHAAACASLIPGIESHYWWKGKIEAANEHMILFKTTLDQLKKLEKLIVSHHPYDTPEFVVLKITRGNKRYFDWLLKSTGKK